MRLGTVILLAAAALSAQTRQVAVTVDDLPWAHSGAGQCDYTRLQQQTERLLKPISERRIPVTAFAVGTNCSQLSDDQYRSILNLWQKAGAEIGNHTWSHQSLNTMSIADYEADILKADAKLRRLTGRDHIEFFRSPMLHTGPTPEIKTRLESFLAGHGYRQSPVTFDNSDWMFSYVLTGGDTKLAARVRSEYIPYMESVIAFFEKRSVQIVGREFPQILLIHANDLNAEFLPTLLDMLKRRGYTFISLSKALEDPAYKLTNNYAGKGGFSWIHRWAMSMNPPPPKAGEPDEPRWLVDAYEQTRQR